MFETTKLLATSLASQEQLEFEQIWCLKHFRASGSVYSKLRVCVHSLHKPSIVLLMTTGIGVDCLGTL